MRTLALWLAVGLLGLASVARSEDPKPPPPEVFAQEVLSALRRAAPDISFEISGPLEIVGSRQDQTPLHIQLDGVYRNAPGDPAERAESIRTFARTLLKNPSDTLGPADRSRILPVIRDAAFVAKIRRAAGSSAVAEPLVADLWVLYALDSPERVRYLLEPEVEKLGVSGSALRELAVNNLAGKASKARIEEVADGVRWIVLDGVHESSVLLLDSFWVRIAKELGDGPVAAVPTRDILLFAGSSDEGAVVRIREVAERFVSEQAHPISARLLRREGKVWRPLQ